jgi:CMP-N,N'-diacetyllegionaminic acid synthase
LTWVVRERRRNRMKTIALIPARGGSKRIPRKNLIDFCGHPLVSWSIRQALESSVDRVYVSTDDEEIADVSRDYGAVVIERPSELATDSSTLEEVISHAMLSFLTSEITDIVVLQPTSPLRLAADIDNCIKRCSMSVNVLKDAFLWETPDRPITFNQKTRNKYNHEIYEENGSIYCFSYQDFDLYYSRYGFRPTFYVMHKWQSFEIDEPEDVEICEFFMRKYILKGGD